MATRQGEEVETPEVTEEVEIETPEQTNITPMPPQ